MQQQWTPPDSGTLRITNPKTLQKWIDNGKYQEMIDKGCFFGLGCGRFRTEACECSACRKRPKKELIEILKP